jgi:uncharacterized protein (DUF111 family)
VGEQRLLLVQIDDRSGEELRQGLDGLIDMGVRNYQVLSSLTKKGRPGYVLLLDLDSDIESEIMTYLGVELGAWGYHRLQSVHEHFDVAPETREVTFAFDGRREQFTVFCKVLRRDGQVCRVKMEHRDVIRIVEQLAHHGHPLPHTTLRTRVESEIAVHPDLGELTVLL